MDCSPPMACSMTQPWRPLQNKIRNPKSEIRNPKSEIRNPKSEIRNPKSEIRNPKSEIRNKFESPKEENRKRDVFPFWIFFFGFWICFGFRISNFGFCLWLFEVR